MLHKYADIDIDLEATVFLFAAKENDSALYSLIWELSYYDLTIEDKYKVAHQIINSLTRDNFVTVEKFKDQFTSDSIETVSLDNMEVILNSPSSWYPGDTVYAIVLTDKGKAHLIGQTEKYKDRLENRLFRK